MPLTGKELDFLCDLTTTKFVDVASLIEVSKGTISKLVSKDEKLGISQSIQLKKWFWGKIFGTHAIDNVPPVVLFDEKKLLLFLKEEAERSDFLKAM